MVKLVRCVVVLMVLSSHPHLPVRHTQARCNARGSAPGVTARLVCCPASPAAPACLTTSQVPHEAVE
jgi:hypothetical protein